MKGNQTALDLKRRSSAQTLFLPVGAASAESGAPASQAENMGGHSTTRLPPTGRRFGFPTANAQNPAVSREFPGLNLDTRGNALPSQTEWRWRESGANSSLRPDPC